MASINTLRTTFGHNLKGKSRSTVEVLSAPASRFFASSSRTCTPSAGPSSQASSSAAQLGASPSSGPLPTAPVESASEALQLLRTQPHHYVVASITGRTFLVAPSDVVTVPRLKDCQVGDVIELDRIHELGSRDYTLRAQDPMHCRTRGPGALMRRSTLPGQSASLAASAASQSTAVAAGTESGSPAGTTTMAAAATTSAAGTGPQSRIADEVRKVSSSWATRLHPAGLAHVGAVLSPQTVRVRAVVVEHTRGEMERIVKKKRRKGYKKTIEHKQPYTRIRIERIEVAPRDLQ